MVEMSGVLAKRGVLSNQTDIRSKLSIAKENNLSFPECHSQTVLAKQDVLASLSWPKTSVANQNMPAKMS